MVATPARPTNSSDWAQLFDSLDAGVLVQDRETRVLYANALATRLLGLSEQALSERTAFDSRWDLLRGDGTAIPGDELPAPVALRTGQPVHDVLIGVGRLQAERSWLLVTAVPISPDAAGQHQQCVVTLRDATALRSALAEAEAATLERLEETKRVAEGLQRAQRREAMGDLAAGVAHNFNNMLAVVLPGLESLRGRVSGDGHDLADSIQAVQRAAELVRQLMYFARGDVGQTPSQRIQLAAVVEEVVGLCRRTFDRSITFEVDLPTKDATTEGSVSHLQQVVMNLLLNARDALQGRTGPRIGVRLSVNPGPVPGQPPGFSEQHCTLEISDNGAGMDEATQHRLGEPFFTTKPPGKGTGLGLATVLGTLRNMRAAYQLRSAPSEGTTFFLHFPARAPAAPRTPSKPPPALTSSARILVVDDEPLVRRTLKRVLESVKMYVTEAEHGERALEILALRKGEIDAVLLDLSMPGLPGLEVLRRVRELYPTVPVIVLSGDLGAHPPAGAAAALQKPVLLRELQGAIHEVLAKR